MLQYMQFWGEINNNLLGESGMVVTISVLFNLYIFILIARLIINIVHADYFNPACKFIYKLTQPLIALAQKVLPEKDNMHLAVIIPLFLIEIIKIYLLLLLSAGSFANIFGAFFWAFGELARFVLDIFFYLVIIRILLSWIAISTHNSYTVLLIQVTEPILLVARQKIPPLGGIDLSALVVLLLLKASVIIIANPLLNLGIRFALGLHF
ncbi:MAG: YggT family protein [Gammaproteobacteria bacterium]|nr:YggT family protein [Gammaproteobacteria bacterium]